MIYMTIEEKQKLYLRNQKIIEIVLQKIKNDCFGAVDLIGIGGSFCNGDFYSKSDLDLVIISNHKSAKCLDMCFILDEIGFDIYTQDWNRFERMSEYHHPYVTKLLDLNIVYCKEKSVLEKYHFYQKQLLFNMNNIAQIHKYIGIHYDNVLKELKMLENASTIGFMYRALAHIIQEIEFILFMINRTYIKKGTKRIPDEIAQLTILPQQFLAQYPKVIQSKTTDEIKRNTTNIVISISKMLQQMDIKKYENREKKHIITKKNITASHLVGTYEEIYSNWKNKMDHAFDTNNVYLSFVTMSSCQDFYDEMAEQFHIPAIELMQYFNPDDLKENINSFQKVLHQWKKLYDKWNIPINQYQNLEEFKKVYLNQK